MPRKIFLTISIGGDVSKLGTLEISFNLLLLLTKLLLFEKEKKLLLPPPQKKKMNVIIRRSEMNVGRFNRTYNNYNMKFVIVRKNNGRGSKKVNAKGHMRGRKRNGV